MYQKTSQKAINKIKITFILALVINIITITDKESLNWDILKLHFQTGIKPYQT